MTPQGHEHADPGSQLPLIPLRLVDKGRKFFCINYLVVAGVPRFSHDGVGCCRACDAVLNTVLALVQLTASGGGIATAEHAHYASVIDLIGFLRTALSG
jgi:hypothetical protein